ncbi:ATP-binding protein [Actinomadura soli]|uniref:ATP-binding protein n=1 Tax=Actinomadura soli TaxID=2508997 RepID=UPI0038B2367E
MRQSPRGHRGEGHHTEGGVRLPPAAAGRLVVAIWEAVTNAMPHGRTPAPTVDICLSPAGDEVIATIADHAPRLRPRRRARPAGTAAPAAARWPGSVPPPSLHRRRRLHLPPKAERLPPGGDDHGARRRTARAPAHNDEPRRSGPPLRTCDGLPAPAGGTGWWRIRPQELRPWGRGRVGRRRSPGCPARRASRNRFTVSGPAMPAADHCGGGRLGPLAGSASGCSPQASRFGEHAGDVVWSRTGRRGWGCCRRSTRTLFIACHQRHSSRLRTVRAAPCSNTDVCGVNVIKCAEGILEWTLIRTFQKLANGWDGPDIVGGESLHLASRRATACLRQWRRMFQSCDAGKSP